MRLFCKFFSAAFIGVLVVSTLSADVRPNIVLFLTDDMGWSDLSCYGNPFHETPIIDSLAANGVRFERAYSPAAICQPSRASILSGQFPARNHRVNNTQDFGVNQVLLSAEPGDRSLDVNLPTIAKMLQSTGYRTAHFGKWGISQFKDGRPNDYGYDEYMLLDTIHSTLKVANSWKNQTYIDNIPSLYADLEEGEYANDPVMNGAINFIRENKNQPFFLHYNTYLVHTPIATQMGWLVEKYSDKQQANSSLRNRSTIYAAMMETVDYLVGQLVDELDAQGLLENTIFVFTSDNGSLRSAHGYPVTKQKPLQGAKGEYHEGGIRIPAIIHWPAQIPEGFVSSMPVHLVDLFPTFAASVGAPVNHASLDGVDLTPHLTNQEQIERPFMLFHAPYYRGSYPPTSVYIEGDYKYLIQYPGGKRELYLPDSDVGETQNLVTSLKDVAIAMDAQLISTLQSYDAPLPIANSRRVPAIPNANVFLNDDGEMIVTDTPGVSLSAGVERVTSSASMFERFGAAGSGKALQLSYPSSYSFRIPPQLGSGIGMALDFRIDENSSGFKLLLSGSSFGSLSSIFIHPSSMTLPEELVSLPVVPNLDYRVVLTFRPFGSGETLGFLQLIRISGNDSVSVAHSERFSLSELSGDYGAFSIYAESNTDSADIYSISAWMLPLIFEDFQDEDTNSAPSRWDIEKVEGLSAEILSGASSYYSPDNHSKSLKLSFLDGYSNGSCVYSVTPEDYSQIEVEVLLGSLDGAISMHITEDLSLVFDSEGAVAGVGTYLNFHDSNLYLGALPSNVTWLRVVLDFVSQTASLYYQASASPIVTNFSSLNIAPPYVTQLSLDAAVDTVGALSINNIYGFVMDQDGDMLADSIEEILNLDSSKPDTDSDLLSDLWELDFGTSGNNPDVDLDGLPDGWELMTNSNPYFPDASESKLLGYLSGRRDGLVGAPSWGGLLQFEALNLKSRFFSNALLYYDIYLDHSEDLLNWEEAVVPLAIEFSVGSNYTDFDHVFESNHGSRFYRLRAKQKP